MERRRGRADQIRVSVPGYDVVISPTNSPKNLSPLKSAEQKKEIKRKIPTQPRKEIKMTGEQLDVLSHLASKVYSRETEAVGEAGFNYFDKEQKIQGRTIEKEDYKAAVLAIKNSSTRITPEDIAKVIAKNVQDIAVLDEKGPRFIAVLARLTAAITDFWPKESSAPKSRKR